MGKQKELKEWAVIVVLCYCKWILKLFFSLFADVGTKTTQCHSFFTSYSQQHRPQPAFPYSPPISGSVGGSADRDLSGRLGGLHGHACSSRWKSNSPHRGGDDRSLTFTGSPGGGRDQSEWERSEVALKTLKPHLNISECHCTKSKIASDIYKQLMLDLFSKITSFF